MPIGDVSVDRYDHREGNDDFSQAGDLYRLMEPDAKARLVENLTVSPTGLIHINQEVQMRQLCQFFRADPDLGQKVDKALGVKIDPAMLKAPIENAMTQSAHAAKV